MIRADLLLSQLQALANPVRLWIVAELHRNGTQYVSELARNAGISRPLLKMHLRKLEEAQLVTSEVGTAENGKSANFFRIVPFDLPLTPDTITGTEPVPTSLATRKDGDNDA
ncbi:winged helix-turn-helix domain-containing protein [Hasllibacter sp. MH4015]|uniref:ArsR/SmtB family transcription factor n=1 Tax=Hasllibacter sp. MH4015 TaxID=2854029 RepID=UPI001CD5857D|nr:winged helix-turn-helix domain-containing protein [Hasllibacter sp. MH4015]